MTNAEIDARIEQYLPYDNGGKVNVHAIWLDGWNAAIAAAAEACDVITANARPLCESNYTDGDSWTETCANAVRALTINADGGAHRKQQE